jgi:4-amino-4-deoxy-L-arabinose transferase-like glycosyltransferase
LHRAPAITYGPAEAARVEEAWGPGTLLEEHGWSIPLLAVAIVALGVRPLIPPDETRYLAVAWEMWTHHSFSLPLLNGQPYADKPPLLFWLIQLGWLPFGVNQWWPRLLPAIQAIGNVYLLGSLARQLWPDQPRVRLLAMWMLAGSFGWMIFASLLLFDMLLVTWTVLAMVALLRGATSARWQWHLLYGACITLGILSKGPVILLHILPAALLAPWWAGDRIPNKRAWYLRTGLAVAGGAAATLLWVLPAASTGGPEYADQILWHQTAGRLHGSFAHARAWWFYLAAFPALATPWIFSRAAWRGIVALSIASDRGARLLLSGLLPALAIFSVISAKQVHYLLPWLPGAVLLLAAGFQPGRDRRAKEPLKLPPAALSSVAARVDLFTSIRHVTMAGGVVVCWLVIGAFRHGPLGGWYDTGPAALVLAGAEGRGAPIASVTAYQGEFSFGARLRNPVTVVGAGAGPATWCGAHPTGVIIDRSGAFEAPAQGLHALFDGTLRRGRLRVWACA